MKGIDREACKVRARARSDRYGEMKEVRVTVQESEKRRATFHIARPSALQPDPYCSRAKYLSNSPNILSAIFLAETQVLVQSKSYIVPVKSIGGQP